MLRHSDSACCRFGVKERFEVPSSPPGTSVPGHGPSKVFGAVRRAPGWVGSTPMLEPPTDSVTVVSTIHPSHTLASQQ
jgi:hypothetical protein